MLQETPLNNNPKHQVRKSEDDLNECEIDSIQGSTVIFANIFF